MTKTVFVELASADPVEQAIARKVMRILNDHTLDRQRRVALVRQAQHELLEHRQRASQAPQPKKRRQKVPQLDPIQARRRELRSSQP